MNKRMIILAAIAFSPFWGPLMLRAAGYYINEPGWSVAEIALQKKDIRYCKRILIMPWRTSSPSTKEQKDECVFRFAVGTDDASICEQLLPSDYALACLSEIGGNLQGDIPCTQADGKTSVYCNETYSEGEVTIENPQIENCKLYQRKDLREWCHYERTTKFANIHECNEIERVSVKDECQENYAFKEKNISNCLLISDEMQQKYCEIRINTWLKYPELRNSFYFGEPMPTDT